MRGTKKLHFIQIIHQNPFRIASLSINTTLSGRRTANLTSYFVFLIIFLICMLFLSNRCENLFSTLTVAHS